MPGEVLDEDARVVGALPLVQGELQVSTATPCAPHVDGAVVVCATASAPHAPTSAPVDALMTSTGGSDALPRCVMKTSGYEMPTAEKVCAPGGSRGDQCESSS